MCIYLFFKAKEQIQGLAYTRALPLSPTFRLYPVFFFLSYFLLEIMWLWKKSVLLIFAPAAPSADLHTAVCMYVINQCQAFTHH